MNGNVTMSPLLRENASAIPGAGWKILNLSVAHLFNDWYMNLLQVLLPFLVAAGLGLGKSGFLISAFMFTSSIIQPILGYWIDRKQLHWLVCAGTLWMAVLLGLIGCVDAYPLQLLLASAAGLGTAAFHPQASAMVSTLSGGRKGFMQAIFITFGNIGWALTPVMAIPVLQHFGLRGTPLLMIPGIIVAILLWANPVKPMRKNRAAAVPLREIIKKQWKGLGRIVVIVSCRSLTYFGLTAFLAVYLHAQGVSLSRCGTLLFLMLFTGALGGLAGGYLSDLFGRRAVIVVSLPLSGLLFWLFLGHFQGIGGAVLLALAGAALLATFSVTVVAAQELISGNSGFASGLMLGFAFGIGGLGVGLMGICAQAFGISPTLHAMVLLPVLAGILGIWVKVPKNS